MPSTKWGLAVIAVAASVLSPASTADPRAFQKIADTATPIPGGSGNFSTLVHAQVHQGNVVFAGAGPSNQRGIFRFDPATSALSTVVDQTTTLPGTGQPQLYPNMADGSFAIFGPDVAFAATAPFNQQILTTRGGLHAIAGANTVAMFGYDAPVSLSDQLTVAGLSLPRGGGSVVESFAQITNAGDITNWPALENIFKYLARGNTVPHTTRGRILGTPGQHILNSSVGTFRFTGSPSEPPAFLVPGEAAGPTLPGSTTGTIFSDDGASVVFRAVTPTRTVLLTQSLGGTLRVLVDTNTLIPTFDNTSTFASFTDVAIDNGVIAFIGAPAAGPAGIFTESNGALTEIVSTGDTIDGKTIETLDFANDRPLSAHTLVFTATFSDGSTGLYLASVPEPATLAFLAFAATPALLRRRLRLTRANEVHIG